MLPAEKRSLRFSITLEANSITSTRFTFGGVGTKVKQYKLDADDLSVESDVEVKVEAGVKIYAGVVAKGGTRVIIFTQVLSPSFPS